MAISEKKTSCTESAFEIINNLEKIFNGAFVKTDDSSSTDETFFTVHVKLESVALRYASVEKCLRFPF